MLMALAMEHKELGIVILEDEQVLANSLRAALERALGVQVFVARNTKELHDKLQSIEPIAASVDWRSGERDMGPIAIDILRERQAELPIVVYTQHNVKDIREAANALELRVERFLSKEPEEETWVKCMRNARDYAVMRDIASQLGDADPELEEPRFDKASEQRHQYATALCRLHLGALRLDQVGVGTASIGADLERRSDASSFVSRVDIRALAAQGLEAGVRGLIEVVECPYEELLSALVPDYREVEDLTSDPRFSQLARLVNFVAQVTDYRLEYMRQIWWEGGMFNDQLDPPPWNGDGLLAFLLENEGEGLEAALAWIDN